MWKVILSEKNIMPREKGILRSVFPIYTELNKMYFIRCSVSPTVLFVNYEKVHQPCVRNDYLSEIQTCWYPWSASFQISEFDTFPYRLNSQNLNNAAVLGKIMTDGWKDTSFDRTFEGGFYFGVFTYDHWSLIKHFLITSIHMSKGRWRCKTPKATLILFYNEQK